MPLLEKISIKGFRGIREGEVHGFTPLSILVGRNNSGKSSVLEATYFLLTCCERHRDSVEMLVTRRGWFGASSVSYLFHTEEPISFEASCSGKLAKASIDKSIVADQDYVRMIRPLGFDVENASFLNLEVECPWGRVSWRIAVNDEGKVAPPLSSKPLVRTGHPQPLSNFIDHSAVRYFGQVEKVISEAELEDAATIPTVVRLLNVSYPDVTDIRILSMNNKMVACVRMKDRSYPYYVLGDGLKMTLPTLVLAATTKQGVLLIEEPENFQHPSSARVLIRGLLKAASEGTQIIMSTHSLEFIEMVLEHARDSLDLVSLIHLRLQNGALTCSPEKGAEALKARHELELDLRGA